MMGQMADDEACAIHQCAAYDVIEMEHAINDGACAMQMMEANSFIHYI